MMHKSGRNDAVNPGASVKTDVTLGDYIARKSEPPKKKLTFEEWWASSDEQLLFGERRKSHFKCCWKAAQENV